MVFDEEEGEVFAFDELLKKSMAGFSFCIIGTEKRKEGVCFNASEREREREREKETLKMLGERDCQ